MEVFSTDIHRKKIMFIKNSSIVIIVIIILNDYMTFPYKIKVDKCVGSCNDKGNPYFKVCTPDTVKNISVKVFELISQKMC